MHRNVELPTPAIAMPASPCLSAIDQQVRSSLRHRQMRVASAIVEMESRADRLSAMAAAIADALREGHKLLVAGNGGSASESQHVAAELVGRFLRERRPLAAIALTTDSSILTSLGNDYSFDDVFARQVEGLGKPGDVLLLYSTSGTSANIVCAARAAHRSGLHVPAVTGDAPSPLANAADLTYRVPATETPLVQELQMIVTHDLCEVVESCVCGEQDGAMS